MSANKRRWARYASLLNGPVMLCCFSCTFLAPVAASAKLPYLATMLYSIFCGYIISMVVSQSLWGRCPLMIANDLFHDYFPEHPRPYYSNSKIWKWTETKFGFEWIPYVAVIQPVVLCILVSSVFTLTICVFLTLYQG